jgi:hypothetical protein
MYMNTTTNTATARRITKNGKIVVEITNPDGSTEIMGGARAERAEAVIVGQYSGEFGALGLRADFAKAQAEAANLLKVPMRRGEPCGSAARIAYAVRIAD